MAKQFVAIQLIVLILGWANIAYSQLKLEAGEKVKVFVFTEWVDGEARKAGPSGSSEAPVLPPGSRRR